MIKIKTEKQLCNVIEKDCNLYFQNIYLGKSNCEMGQIKLCKVNDTEDILFYPKSYRAFNKNDLKKIIEILEKKEIQYLIDKKFKNGRAE